MLIKLIPPCQGNAIFIQDIDPKQLDHNINS
ncbi:MAG: hypothetical protein ACI9M9_002220 [Flavobacteriaceae bacterium]